MGFSKLMAGVPVSVTVSLSPVLSLTKGERTCCTVQCAGHLAWLWEPHRPPSGAGPEPGREAGVRPRGESQQAAEGARQGAQEVSINCKGFR